MEQVALKTIIFFSVVFLFTSLFCLDMKEKYIINFMKIMQCVFHVSTICVAMSGLGLIK